MSRRLCLFNDDSVFSTLKIMSYFFPSDFWLLWHIEWDILRRLRKTHATQTMNIGQTLRRDQSGDEWMVIQINIIVATLVYEMLDAATQNRNLNFFFSCSNKRRRNAINDPIFKCVINVFFLVFIVILYKPKVTRSSSSVIALTWKMFSVLQQMFQLQQRDVVTLHWIMFYLCARFSLFFFIHKWGRWLES